MALLQDGQLLLVHQTYRCEQIWTMPGGGIEEGETAAEAAVREVREETCLETRVIRLLYSGPRNRGSGFYYCYLGEMIGGELQLGVDPELVNGEQDIDDVRWWHLDLLTEHSEVSLILPALYMTKGISND